LDIVYCDYASFVLQSIYHLGKYGERMELHFSSTALEKDLTQERHMKRDYHE
jgi:hypothetical protein